MLGVRRPQQPERRQLSRVVHPLRVVRPDGVTAERHVRDGQHLISAQRSPEGHEQPVGVDVVVHARRQRSPPARLPNRIRGQSGDRFSLDVPLHLLPGEGVVLETVELDRARARSFLGGGAVGPRASTSSAGKPSPFGDPRRRKTVR